MKRINLTVLTVLILAISLSISTVNCSAAEPYFTDLIEAELATQEVVDMYNFYLSSDIVKIYLEEINSYKYVIVSCSVDASASYLHFYCFNDDVVMYKYFAEIDVLGVISKSEVISYKRFSFGTNNNTLNPDGSLKVTANSSSEWEYNTKHVKDDVTYCKSPHYYGVCGVGKLVRCDVPIYQDVEDAVLALEGNDIKPLYNDVKADLTASNFTSDQIYLDDFQCIYHDAPELDDCYVEFKYSIPKHLRNAKGSLYIDLFDVYKWDIRAYGVLDIPYVDTFGSDLFNVSENPYGFTIPITDFASIQQVFNSDKLLPNSFGKRQILGNEIGVDFDNYTFGGIGLNNIAEITKSRLFLDIQLRLGSKTLGKNGVKYTASVDFLDLSNCYYESSKYDDYTETYKPNNDTVKDGYYSTDGNGNYNYHSPTGDTTTITSYDYSNSNNSTQYITNNYYGSGGGGGNYDWLTPSISDWSNPADFLAALKKGVGFIGDITTGDTGNGLFSMMTGFYNILPDGIRDVIVFGIVVVVILGIISLVIKVVF